MQTSIKIVYHLSCTGCSGSAVILRISVQREFSHISQRPQTVFSSVLSLAAMQTNAPYKNLLLLTKHLRIIERYGDFSVLKDNGTRTRVVGCCYGSVVDLGTWRDLIIGTNIVTAAPTVGESLALVVIL